MKAGTACRVVALAAPLLLLGPCAGLASAADVPGTDVPGTTLAAATVDVDMSGDGRGDLVRAEYHLAGRTPEAGVIGLVSPQRVHTEITDLRVAEGGDAPAAPLDRGRSEVTLPAGTDRFVLEHRVRRAPDVPAVPLVVPDIPTGERADVSVSALLPPGAAAPSGDSMPKFEQITTEADRVRLSHDSQSLPAVVVLPDGGAGPSTSSIVSLVGGLALGAAVLIWLVVSFRKEPADR